MAVNLSLALLVIVVLVIACFAWKSYSKKLTKERKVCSEHAHYPRPVHATELVVRLDYFVLVSDTCIFYAVFILYACSTEAATYVG